MSSKPPILLHLGCGYGRIEGWVNADLNPTPTTDMVFDLMKPWPIEDGQVREIYASHVLEHLPDFRHFFREAWRVLEPNGGIVLRVPYGGHRLAWIDPTHVKAWYAESFCFLQPGYGDSVKNPQEKEWDAPFGISHVQLKLAAKWAFFMRHWLTRKLLLPWMDNIENSVEEIWAFLFALKTPEAARQFLAHRQPNSAFSRYVMYQHHLEGREDLRPGEVPVLTELHNYTAKYGFDTSVT